MQKDTNPKDALGTAKWRQFMTVPRQVLWELGVAMLEGALKYGRHNYRASGVRASVYLDAAYGHLDQFCEGEDIDKDSGLSHITKAMASLAVLRDAMMNDFWTDDRPPKVGDLDGVRERLQALVAENFERYADKDPHHYTQIEDGAPYRENDPSGQRGEQFEGEFEVDERLNGFASGGFVSGPGFTLKSMPEPRVLWESKMDPRTRHLHNGGSVEGDVDVFFENPETFATFAGLGHAEQAAQPHGDDTFQINLGSVSQDDMDTEIMNRVRLKMAEAENEPTPEDALEERGFQIMFESLFGALPDGYVVEHQRVGDVEILHIGPGDVPIEDWNATDNDFDTEEILRVALSTDIHAYEAHLEDNSYLPDKPLDVLGDDDPSQLLYVHPLDPEFDRSHIVEGLTMKQIHNLVVREAEDIACALYHGDTVVFDSLLRRVLIRLKSQPLRQVRIDFATGGSSERSTRLTNDQWFVACPFCRCTEMFGASPFVPRSFA